ncbi:MAG: elongation factor G [Lachnospiraceae bacterium]|nr:elongation factor G [Lachnospiraceae bacterium]MBQ9562082.1 elongation factor G [Lachnospiraceae bacterium]
MQVYSKDQIRNIVLMGHGGSGKTTLVESMAYATGITQRQGRVEDGNTISDFDKEEQKRLFSIGTTVVPIEYQGVKVNVLDTPGYFDFVGEVEEAMTVADAAVIVVAGKAGVEVGAQKAWGMCAEKNLPRLIYIADMDIPEADYAANVEVLKELFGNGIAPVIVPIREGGKLVGFANVITQKGYKYTAKGASAAADIPGDVASYIEEIRETLTETIAETSEELMEKYFEEGELSEEDMLEGLKLGVAAGDVVPVICGSSVNAQGALEVLNMVKDLVPAPSVVKLGGINTKTDEPFEGDFDESKPVTARVFKTMVDPFIGRFSLIQVCTGILKSDSVVYNVQKETEEKLSRLYVLRGKEQIEVKELRAGDIGAIGKLSDTATGDTLATKAVPVAYEVPAASVPYTYQRYVTKNKGDADKVSQALARLMDEDRTLKAVNDKENRQTLIYGIGEQQLDVVVSKMASRYKVEVEIKRPKVAYRETLRKKVEIRKKYKKQSGGHGQYGDVAMEFEPSGDNEKAYIFEERVFGGAVPKNYFPAVEKGIADSVEKGPLAGYPVVGLKATLTDGSYHPVDSSEMAFKTASSMAFKEGFMMGNPVLLEPIASMKVVVPNAFTGDIMGDLNKRRGRVLGMNPVAGGKTEIVADIPVESTFGYSTDLRSMTGGIGEYSYEFARYEQAPADVQQKVVEEAKKAEEEEA